MAASFGFISLVVLLPVLIGQWIGILGLGKGDRGVEWWLMLVGICGTTLGILISPMLSLLLVFGVSTASPGFSFAGLLPFYVMSACSSLGSILFAAGFAIHGQRNSKHVQRIRELESIAQAQNEELARARAV